MKKSNILVLCFFLNLFFAFKVYSQSTVKRNYKSMRDSVYYQGDIIKAPDIRFYLNQFGFINESKDSILLLARFIQKHPTFKVEIGVHSDVRGNKIRNQKLSQCRADSLVNFLIKTQNIPATSLVAKGYGGSQPLVNSSSENPNWSMEELEMFYFKNRRIEIKILSTGFK